MKKSIFKTFLILVVAVLGCFTFTSCYSTLINGDKGIVSKIELDSSKSSRYKYRVTCDYTHTDRTQGRILSGTFVFMSNVNYNIGDTIEIK